MGFEINNRERSIMVKQTYSRKTRLLIYEIEKQRIQRKNLSASDYERAIKELTEMLKV